MKTADATQLGLAIVHLPIGSIRPNRWNPNRQSDIVARAERESIERYGFIDPVTVWVPDPAKPDDYEIIDGEHRWRTALDLDYTEIPAVVLDVTEAEAKRLTIVLNETRGDADVVLLGQLLADLKAMTDEDTFPVALPYTTAELEHLLSIGAEDWDQFRTGLEPPAMPPTDLRELTLTMDTDTFDQFNRWVEMLGKEWALPDVGVTALVVEAVKRQALSANQGRKKT